MSLHLSRTLFVVASGIGASASAYYGQPYVSGNSDAILIVVTVLTIFAGFLIAIISVVGDPALLPVGSWRKAEIRRPNVHNELLRHSMLFYVYLIGIAFLFVGVLVNEAKIGGQVQVWIERTYLFFGVFGFFLSFGLPVSILALQMKRYDAEIDKRRAEVGIGKEASDQE